MANDAAESAPNVYTVLFENKRVRASPAASYITGATVDVDGGTNA
jgi:hypothetical protein